MANRIKSDSTTKRIAQSLREEGATVHYIRSRRGSGQDGMPDLLVGFNGKTFLLECKAENGELSEKQILWHSSWTGTKVEVVSTELEALMAIGLTP